MCGDGDDRKDVVLRPHPSAGSPKTDLSVGFLGIYRVDKCKSEESV